MINSYKATYATCNQENLKKVAVSRKSTENAMTKRKKTNNDLQNNTQKTKERATRTSLKNNSDELSALEG